VTRGPKYAPLIIGGAVMPDNTPAGSFRWENRDLQLWDSPTQLPCLPGPSIEDRPPKPDTPKPVVADQPLPAPQQTPAPQETPAPEKAAPLAPEPDQLCIPNPFGLDFPGAC
jgi:hypothetical protein